MRYCDMIYGRFDITEPVILQLIKSPALKRLKSIDQSGYGRPFFQGRGYSRFDHSLGVFLLLKKFKAGLREQIAGLIHDVSHSVFSHCIDYALDSGSEKRHDWQDKVFESFVRKSEIPGILKKYGADVGYILDDSHFPLKETQLPDLCADRIDYSLRSAVTFNLVSRSELKKILDDLIVIDNKWVFKNKARADHFAKIFLKLNREYFSGLLSAVMFQSVGSYLRHALKRRYLTRRDLYLTDPLVLAKANRFLHSDPQLNVYYQRMNNKIAYRQDPRDYEAKVFCKSRVVDPYCFYKGEIKRLSSVEIRWQRILKEESKPKEYFIKFQSVSKKTRDANKSS